MENIANILEQIEKEYRVKVLYACETGSRAWGFPSPDSDYDIRFIYMHEGDWYLSLNERKDTIEFMLNEELDITGWDLRKSLSLLKKSNAALIERFRSPIEYYSASNFKHEFKNLLPHYYSPVAVFYHHYSLAKKFWEDDVQAGETHKLKSYFYMIRSLLSCNWIIENSEVLPMHIEGLMTLIADNRKDELRELIKLKSTVGEKYLHCKDKSLHSWILELWNKVEASKNNVKANTSNYNLLNDFFLKTLHENPDNR